MPNMPKLATRTCELCGNQFTNAASSPAKYCSQTCRGKASRLFDGEDFFKFVPKRRNGNQIKYRLLELGWEEKCAGAGCQVGTEWLGESITLELDHIDGDSCNDNLWNLRLLCPNCHSQTDTFRARNRGRKHVHIFPEPMVTDLTAPAASVNLE